MDLYTETKSMLNKYNIKANKSLGQNFLINDDILEKIINSAEITKEDTVIEIGPGLGTLTNKLLENAKKVIAVEVDFKMAQLLKDRFKNSNNLQIINEDILKLDLKKIIAGKTKVVANLPYYITTPIIMKLLEEKLELESITVMVQKEVAQRIVEIPGGKNCGAITYAIHYYTKPEHIIDVSKDMFLPSPKVDSAVIKLNILKNVKKEKLLFKIIKYSFSQRRKTLLNALTNSGILQKQETVKMLQELGIEENRRGETLTLDEFKTIANYIEERGRR